MVAEKELEDVWLQNIPWILRLVQLLVLMYCSWKLVVVGYLCCQFLKNDELHHYLFLKRLKAGANTTYFCNNCSSISLTTLLFEVVVLTPIHFLRTLQRSVLTPI